MSTRPRQLAPGPFRAEQLHSGDPYELSNGHAILCLPTGGRGSGPNGLGFSAVGWDPKVKEAGVDTGYSPNPSVLRAPDVAIGNVPDKPGWVPGAPGLAIEYADQDEQKLEEKIADLLAAGTRFLWVVRLSGPRRVEVHEAGKKMRAVLPGHHLTAPGVLKNPVLVEALYDRDAAERATLTNLLQRRGFEDLEAVLAEGRKAGLAEGHQAGLVEGQHAGLAAAVLAVLASRQIAIPRTVRKRIEQCADTAQLHRWVGQAVVVKRATELVALPGEKAGSARPKATRRR